VIDLAPILQGFLTARLARQKKASPNTVAWAVPKLAHSR
jgi:hypothetical protein